MLRSANDSVRKFKAAVEPHLVPEAFTAFSKAVDEAEAQAGRAIALSDADGLALIGQALEKTGVWASLNVDPNGSYVKQYVAEDTTMAKETLEAGEKERARTVESFGATLGH